MANLTQLASEPATQPRAAARQAGEPRAQRARADRPGRARRREGAARRARPHAPLAPDAAGATARRAPTSCCWRRPTCAPTMPASPTRSPPAASGLPARSPTCAAARRLRLRHRARPGRASCTASAGCGISTAGASSEDGRIARKLVGEWIKRSHGPLDLAWAARDRGPPRPRLAGARRPAARWRRPQALRRRHAQPDRADHVSLHLLARRARRLPRVSSP